MRMTGKRKDQDPPNQSTLKEKWFICDDFLRACDKQCYRISQEKSIVWFDERF